MPIIIFRGVWNVLFSSMYIDFTEGTFHMDGGLSGRNVWWDIKKDSRQGRWWRVSSWHDHSAATEGGTPNLDAKPLNSEWQPMELVYKCMQQRSQFFWFWLHFIDWLRQKRFIHQNLGLFWNFRIDWYLGQQPLLVRCIVGFVVLDGKEICFWEMADTITNCLRSPLPIFSQTIVSQAMLRAG